MEDAYQTGSHTTPSPSGLLLACIADRSLRIRYTRAPQQFLDFQIWCPPAKIRRLIWASDSSKVLVFTTTNIEVVNLEDEKHRVRIENGTGGVGRFESAGFLDQDNVITVWEYGRAKIWHLTSGQTKDIDSIKTLTTGPSWAHRPVNSGAGQPLAYLSRPGAEDLLGLFLNEDATPSEPAKVPTQDAQALSWSPDGNWIAVLDAPQYTPGLYLFTADGHLFRSYPSKDRLDSSTSGLGIKDIRWSPDSQRLVLLRFDKHIELVAARTLSSIAVLEHVSTIQQASSAARESTNIWQEQVAAGGSRSYALLSQPVTPPRTQRPDNEQPEELGTALTAFDSSGAYLATIDTQMQSTVWIWDVEIMQLHAVLIQHGNIKKMLWHGAIPGCLLLDSGDNTAYLWNVVSPQEPICTPVSSSVSNSFSFVPTPAASGHPIILASSKEGFTLLYPLGRDPASDSAGQAFADGDSIFEALSGKHESSLDDGSVTQRIAYEAEMSDGTARLDDTFRATHKARNGTKDPLDDSEIF